MSRSLSKGPFVDEHLLAKVERGPIQAVVVASGTLNAVTTVQVGSQISGQIKEVLAARGLTLSLWLRNLTNRRVEAVPLPGDATGTATLVAGGTSGTSWRRSTCSRTR